MVECNLAKVEVAGSNPVSRSIKNLMGLIGWKDHPQTVPGTVSKR